MIPHQAEFEAIIRGYQVPSDRKSAKRIKQLERMILFYKARLENDVDMPEKERIMFNGFVESLQYSIAIIKMHRKLTIKLAGLVVGQERVS